MLKKILFIFSLASLFFSSCKVIPDNKGELIIEIESENYIINEVCVKQSYKDLYSQVWSDSEWGTNCIQAYIYLYPGNYYIEVVVTNLETNTPKTINTNLSTITIRENEIEELIISNEKLRRK